MKASDPENAENQGPVFCSGEPPTAKHGRDTPGACVQTLSDDNAKAGLQGTGKINSTETEEGEP